MIGREVALRPACGRDRGHPLFYSVLVRGVQIARDPGGAWAQREPHWGGGGGGSWMLAGGQMARDSPP